SFATSRPPGTGVGPDDGLPSLGHSTIYLNDPIIFLVLIVEQGNEIAHHIITKLLGAQIHTSVHTIGFLVTLSRVSLESQVILYRQL
ncbi:hypothetical protein ACJX0J_031321, partial [Zea mays]